MLYERLLWSKQRHVDHVALIYIQKMLQVLAKRTYKLPKKGALKYKKYDTKFMLCTPWEILPICIFVNVYLYISVCYVYLCYVQLKSEQIFRGHVKAADYWAPAKSKIGRTRCLQSNCTISYQLIVSNQNFTNILTQNFMINTKSQFKIGWNRCVQ